MGVSRRKFLKISGLSVLLGLGGKAAFELLAPGSIDAAMEPAPIGEGKRWAMVIDAKKCLEKQEKDGCKECIDICHRIHNVPNFGNPKEEIKWIWKETYEHTFPSRHNDYVSEDVHGKPFILLCNHCTNPPCVRVCPTKATWKRPDGVVMMDQHRCIGCRFCMAGCPYGSRSFNWGDSREAPKELNPDFPTNMEYPTRSKGVVEKCTFCAERLAKGQIPACVEACAKIKVNALHFGDLADEESEVRELLRHHYAIRRKPELGTEPNVFYLI